MTDRPTLISSPRSQAGFVFRLFYFALAPYAIVFCAALFPVAGALISVAVALVVFVLGESIRKLALSWWIVRKALVRELSFEEFYRTRPPRPFAYYVFYPLLFPYWLFNAEARREFLLFKGYTGVSVAILILTVSYQYTTYWQPDLTLLDYLPIVALTLAIETLLVLAILMPLATTVVAFHQSGRRKRLLVLLLVGLVSSSAALYKIAHRRDPLVSFATRARVRMRTEKAPRRAHDTSVAALRAALPVLLAQPNLVEGDGKVEGPPLDRAHQVLEQFYKHDEAFSFDLWASPRRNPRLLVLYFEARSGHRPIWLAINRQSVEVTDPKLLPKGAFAAMRHAAEE